MSQPVDKESVVSDETTPTHTLTESNSAIANPAAVFPMEITAEIFTQCVHSSPDRNILLILLGVSRRWRSIAFATSSLWSSVSDQGVRPIKFPELLKMWLGHGGNTNAPFSLFSRHVTNPMTLGRILAVLMDHSAPRVHKIDISLAKANLQQFVYSSPHLRSLTINQCPPSRMHYLVNILRGAPNLVEFNLTEIYLLGYYPGYTSPILTHTSLQHLSVGLSGPQSLNFLRPQLLAWLTLPSLQSLDIHQLSNDSTSWLNFLVRSSPPLRSLRIDVEKDRSLDGFVRSLALVPTLTALEVRGERHYATHPQPVTIQQVLFDALADVNILPALERLEYHGRVANRGGYELVLDVLVRRRETLKSFHLVDTSTGYDDLARSFDPLAPAFRDLVNDGTDVFISDRNGVRSVL
ncbi:hypothetical protein FB45DRAFT_1001570 [Roridomyces roridus]|uniref:F-box domain-containing protein n=1 Tax=Roridomyces roridus TaxID=1738132 RepID=A0AAD7C183_9AGAR|nr:hypothetical protein FB45DRAFT_1001570 [Roridomyces roridus]